MKNSAKQNSNIVSIRSNNICRFSIDGGAVASVKYIQGTCQMSLFVGVMSWVDHTPLVTCEYPAWTERELNEYSALERSMFLLLLNEINFYYSSSFYIYTIWNAHYSCEKLHMNKYNSIIRFGVCGYFLFFVPFWFSLLFLVAN